MRANMILHSCRVVVALAWAAFCIPSGYAQGTAFSYQGQLMNNGQPANGNYDITFTLFAYSQYGFPVGPVLTNLDMPVSAGLFSTTLDFGSVFNGSNYWLEIAVRTNGNGYFTILEPRQLVTPVPYAVFSANASNAVNAVIALTANTAASAASVPAGGITGTISTTNLGSNVALLTANGTLPTNVLPSNVPLLTANGTIPTNVLPTNLASLAGMVWQLPSATNVQAQPNIGYLLTNSQQVTITLPASPNIGDIVKVAGVGMGGWVITQNAGQTIAASFTPVGYTPAGLTGAPERCWISIASSSDGTKLAALDKCGGIWTSGDWGSTWAQTSAPSAVWAFIASSSDGTDLAAASDGSGIWTSSDSGTNWGQSSAPNEYWISIASSSDGTKLAALVNGGGIWTSSNSGTNWGQTSAGGAYWHCIASSSDGTKLAAVEMGDFGGIWTSSNSGTNWGPTSAPRTNWYSIASSSDGTILTALVNGGWIWTSSNSGTNWALIIPFNEGWDCIASSSDGTKVAAGFSGIWTFSIAVNTQSSTTPGTAGLLEGNSGSVVELIYAGGGQFIALYQTGSLSGH